MAYDDQGYWIPNRNADDSSRIYSDEQRALQRQRFEEQLAAMGIQLPTPDPTAPSRVRIDDLPTGDMHNPGWGLERPGDAMGPPASLPTAQSGAFPMPQWGTLGGAAGMGQPMSLYERGGGQSAYGGLGMAPPPGSPYGTRGAISGALIGRQSPLPYSKDRQSPTPYSMGRPSPTPYQGSGYSTLGGMSGYGRQRY